MKFLAGANTDTIGHSQIAEEEKKFNFFLVLFLLLTCSIIVLSLLIADEWKHETAYTVSQYATINLVHS